MTECYSARCQQDRKSARREFNKWTKNLLLQIGLETISKNHFEVDANVFHQPDDQQLPNDFNAKQDCLFCLNRQEYLGSKKLTSRNNDYQHHLIKGPIGDDDENAPLDLSLKSTTNHSPLLTANHRSSVKHRPLFDIKSDIPPMYGQEEFDRFMSDTIASQLDFASQPYLNMNLFPTSPTIPFPQSPSNKKKASSSSQDARIAQLAKQMAYERMLQEIEYQRHPSISKKSKSSSSHSPSILTESFHVNHLLNDVMMRILHEMFEKQQQQQQQSTATTAGSQPRASRKGELLFVKKQNINNDEQYNPNVFNHFINQNNNTKKSHKHAEKVNPSSSSSSSTSSVSLTGSASVHKKAKAKSRPSQSTAYVPKGRAAEILNNKVILGNDGKQIRPKRGQYRRYESEQLAKAVAAVLSNEMSVHKAGSYFGVPHSTLEYKVKERNIKTSSATKIKNESTSSTSINENDNNAISQGENEDDEDDKSSKGLGGFLPPSNSSPSANPNELNDENDSDDDDEELEESIN